MKSFIITMIILLSIEGLIHIKDIIKNDYPLVKIRSFPESVLAMLIDFVFILWALIIIKSTGE